MEILGIGMPELLFIILIALIVLGPKDMEKTGRTIGVWLNKLVRSDAWKVFLSTSNEIGKLPYKWMRETNPDLTKWKKDVNAAKKASDAFRAWTGEASENEEAPVLETPSEPLTASEENAKPTQTEESPHA